MKKSDDNGEKVGNYFTSDTDVSIRKYLESTEICDKNDIFVEEIKPAFDKLIENLIYVYGFYTVGDVETLKRDCLEHLYMTLHKFDPDRGKKGFSYFNVVAKNWFIQKARLLKKRDKLESELLYDIDHEIMKNSDSSAMFPSCEDEINEIEFWKELIDQFDVWEKKLQKKTEKQVLHAVCFLLKNTEFIPIYNKKAIYLYLRELTGLNTKQVVMNLKKLKEMYFTWKREYENE